MIMLCVWNTFMAILAFLSFCKADVIMDVLHKIQPEYSKHCNLNLIIKNAFYESYVDIQHINGLERQVI